MISMAATAGLFGTGLTFSQFVLSLFLLVFGAIAIKVSLNFDINEYLKERQKRYRTKIQNACLHFEFFKDQDGSVNGKSFFISPSGTLNYICQRCGTVRMHLDQDEIRRIGDYYAKNLNEYKKKNDRFYKLLKKSGNA